LKITIYGRAPSVNELYRKAPAGHIYLTPVGRRYKKWVKEQFEKAARSLPASLRGQPLTVTFKFYFRHLWHADQTPVMRDYDGPIKIVQDAVAEALKFNDSWIFKAIVEKRQSAREKSVIGLAPYVWEPDEDDA
jgi:Holliday junction resolvase RusA-like endonuclease